MSIDVEGLRKRFNGHVAVDGVSFGVADGEFVTLLGPSGSGKSTILRAISGLEVPDEGRVSIDGEDVTGTPPQDRAVGFVFQHYALFRQMSVLENVAFGLRVRGAPRAEREERARRLLDLVGLDGFENRMPSQLSGGQRQRVALARALAPEPRLLLLDEPFGALDTRLRKELRGWLKDLHDRIRLTTLLVTHDQDEALEISDRVIVVHRGRIEQDGPPRAVFDRPSTEFVATFIGETNSVEAAVGGGRAAWGPLAFDAPGFADGSPVRVHFRPNDVYVSSRPEAGGALGTVREARFLGALTALEIDMGDGRTVTAHVPKGVAERSRFAVWSAVHVSVTAAHVFPAADP